MLKLFNTSTKKLENFKPINKKEVKVYTCGPTVYSTAHIGNLTSYIYWDLLVRTLIANGYKVDRIMNITDVGHLISDQDEGEDKIEKGARKENMTVWDVAKKYTDRFISDFKSLNLIEPKKICRATDYIEENKALINILTEKGFTYETSDGIYFDTSKFPKYADFANLDIKGLKAGARVEFDKEKKNVSDFALWKFIQPGEKHAMRWEYLDRPGYPGWHIECSSIIHTELSETIDIHTGGIDHIPIHHTNEIAQSESAYEKKLSNYWIHCDFITIDNQKISKSLGNIYSIQDLEEKGYSPLDFKTWALAGNYRLARNFDFEGLESARNRRKNWRNKIATTYQITSVEKDRSAQVFSENETKQKILEALNNNLNSASAFAIIDQIPDFATIEIWKYIDSLFGLGLLNSSKDITKAQKELITEREQARKEKNWQKSDEIRTELEKNGITINDTNTGPIWQYL